MCDTCAGSHVGDTVDRTIPDNILNINIVANQCLTVVVHIDDTHQSVAVQSKIQTDRRVLTERIEGIIGTDCR